MKMSLTAVCLFFCCCFFLSCCLFLLVMLHFLACPVAFSCLSCCISLLVLLYFFACPVVFLRLSCCISLLVWLYSFVSCFSSFVSFFDFSNIFFYFIVSICAFFIVRNKKIAAFIILYIHIIYIIIFNVIHFIFN